MKNIYPVKKIERVRFCGWKLGLLMLWRGADSLTEVSWERMYQTVSFVKIVIYI